MTAQRWTTTQMTRTLGRDRERRKDTRPPRLQEKVCWNWIWIAISCLPWHQVTKRLSPSEQEGSEDDSDNYGRRKTKSRTKRRRLHVSDVSRTAEVRFSSRSAGKVTNYNEDESDGFSDEVEEYDYSTAVQTPYEPEVAGIDIIMDYRLKEDAGGPTQYHICRSLCCANKENRSQWAISK